jgi:ABC-type uncharacterized transport system auxiliary subunit
MKSIIIGLTALLLLAGCGGDIEPIPTIPTVDVNKTVVTDVNKTIVKKKKVVVKKQPKATTKKNVYVPPLPTPEVEIDMDSIIDQATDEVVS